MRLVVTLATMLMIGACGGDGGGDDPDATSAGPDAITTGPDAGAGERWVVLAEKAWTLAPGTETMDNATRVLDRDLYVRAIRPIGPPGTHHTLVNVGGGGGDPGTNPDGLIFASGVNTGALYMPPGVGLRLQAGQRVTAQLHLYNVGEAPLSGTSGVEVLLAEPGDIDHLAEIVLAGPLGFSIPPGEHTSTGSCTITTPQTVFAVFPHMHQLGSHFRTSVTTGAGEVVLHDAAYAFDEQRIDAVEPLALAPGDVVHTACTWNNTTGQNVGFGTSSDTEMCFSILFRYPATGGSSYCN